MAVLIPCFIGPAQQAVDTLPMGNLTDYKKGRLYVVAMPKSVNKAPNSGGENGGALYFNSPLQVQEMGVFPPAWQTQGSYHIDRGVCLYLIPKVWKKKLPKPGKSTDPKKEGKKNS